MVEPRILTTDRMVLAGMRSQTSFAEDSTSALWRAFRSLESKIVGRIGTDSFSVKVYGPEYSFVRFDPAAAFEKWAAAKVERGIEQDNGFEHLEIPSGKYVVFLHIGTASDAARTFTQIFGSWLPGSGFLIDERPHFEVLPMGYDPFDPEAREEVWVPIIARV